MCLRPDDSCQGFFDFSYRTCIGPKLVPKTSSPKNFRYLNGVTVDGRNPANQLRLLVDPSIYTVLYIPRGAGFQPLTVLNVIFGNFGGGFALT